MIGATLVLADGTVARTGGHVIKNVAGYDLAKLVHGAYGTLAVIAEVVLRLHPLPARDGDAGAAVPASRRPRSTPPGCSAARTNPRRWSGCPTPGAMLVRLEGTEAALPERIERLRELLGSPRRGGRTGTATRGTSTPGSPAGRSTTPCCGSGCAPPGSPVCSPGCDTRGDHRGARHRRRHRRAARRPGRRRRGPRRRARRGRDLRAAQPPGRARRAGVGSAPVRARRAPRRQAGARPRRPPRTGPARPLADRRSLVTTTPAGSAETNLPQTGPERLRRPPPARSASCSTTACTAASASRPARPTSCGARRWTPRAAGST